MEIKYLGNSSTFIKGKKENIFVNPENVAIESGRYQSRIIAFTSKEMDFLGLENDKVILRGPGEYEIGGVEIVGLGGGNGKTIYLFHLDGLNIAVVGDLDEALSDKKIEKINNVDILLISISKETKIDFKLILEWTKKWGANYLIPIGFEDENENLKKFLDIVDREGLEPIDSFKIDKEEDLPEGMEVLVLKNNNL